MCRSEPAAGGGEYALRIRGDSMIGVGIMDDDLVIIRQESARNGDIVIALLEDERPQDAQHHAGRRMAHAGESGVSADQRHRCQIFWAWSRRFTASIESSLFRHRLSGDVR